MPRVPHLLLALLLLAPLPLRAEPETADPASAAATVAPAPIEAAPIAIPRASLPPLGGEEADGATGALPPPDATGTANNRGTAADLLSPIPAAATSINPAGNNTVTFDELVQNAAHTRLSVNIVWVLLCGVLTLLMAAGLVLFQASLGGVRGTARHLGLHFAVFVGAWLGFWACGFALLFGGYGDLPAAIGWQPALGQGLDWLNREFAPRGLSSLLGKPIGLWGYRGFFLGHVYDTAVFSLFFLQAAVLSVSVAIPLGALAGRWHPRNVLLYAFWFAAVPYAILGNWIWGGGWLAQLGVNYRLGHGVVDFAGSLVVHLAGGVVALVGAALVGPRLDRSMRGSAPQLLPALVLGVALLAAGAVGCYGGATFSGTSARIAVIAVNTLLAAAAGGAAAHFAAGKAKAFAPERIAVGMVAGLSAVAGPGAFVGAPGAVLVGAVAGLLVFPSIDWVSRRLGLDDPAGAVSIHGMAGLWGALAVGLFADGSYGRGFNGVHHLFKGGHLQIVISDGAPETLQNYASLVSPAGGWTDEGVTGLFGPLFGGASWDIGQFIAQGVGVLVALAFVGGLSVAWFRLSGRIAPLRLPEAEERELDA